MIHDAVARREAPAEPGPAGFEDLERMARDGAAGDRRPVLPSPLMLAAASLGAGFGGLTGGDERLLSAVVFAVLAPMGAWVLRFVIGLFRELLDGGA